MQHVGMKCAGSYNWHYTSCHLELRVPTINTEMPPFFGYLKKDFPGPYFLDKKLFWFILKTNLKINFKWIKLQIKLYKKFLRFTKITLKNNKNNLLYFAFFFGDYLALQI